MLLVLLDLFGFLPSIVNCLLSLCLLYFKSSSSFSLWPWIEFRQIMFAIWKTRWQRRVPFCAGLSLALVAGTSVWYFFNLLQLGGSKTQKRIIVLHSTAGCTCMYVWLTVYIQYIHTTCMYVHTAVHRYHLYTTYMTCTRVHQYY